jgi:hypothetical protein
VEVGDGDPGLFQGRDDLGLRVAAAVHHQLVAVAGDARDAGERADRRHRVAVGARSRDFERLLAADGLAEPLDGVFGHQLAVAQDADAVADGVDLLEDVRGEEDGRAALGLRADDLAHLLRAGRVEPGGRLVEDQQVWVVDERHREGEPLAHPLRVLPGVPVRGVGEADARQQRVGVVGGVLRLDGELDVFPPGEAVVHREPVGEHAGPAADRDPVRRHVGAEHADGPRGRADEV